MTNTETPAGTLKDETPTVSTKTKDKTGTPKETSPSLQDQVHLETLALIEKASKALDVYIESVKHPTFIYNQPTRCNDPLPPHAHKTAAWAG